MESKILESKMIMIIKKLIMSGLDMEVKHASEDNSL